MRLLPLFTSFVFASAVPLAHAGQCSATSAAHRVALLELYTSEGCDSCPPADRWVSSLPSQGLGPDRLLVLGFHVDYWNYLGWPDPFARQRFTERQQEARARNRMRFVYTPQLLLDGKDFRWGALRDNFAQHVAKLNQRPPGGSLRFDVRPAPGGALAVQAAVAVEATQKDTARAYIVLYENNLASDVTRGENRGRKLRHDFVVRALAGPFRTTPGKAVEVNHTFRVDSTWKAKDLHVGVFVQDSGSGEVLQALVRPPCS